MEVIKTGKTVDEAIKLGLKEINKTQEEVEIEQLEKGKRGFFGKIHKMAKVKISWTEEREESQKTGDKESQRNDLKTQENIPQEPLGEKAEHIPEKNLQEEPKETPEESHEKNETLQRNKEERKEKLYTFVKEVVENMGDTIEELNLETKGEKLYITIKSKEEKINQKIETLDSLQLIFNQVYYKNWQGKERVIVDWNNKRKAREKELTTLGKRIGETLQQTKEDTVLESMSSYERKIIHKELDKYDNLETYSIGKEPNRRIKIRYLKEKEEERTATEVKQSVENITKVKIF